MLEANVKEDKKAGNENFSLDELGRKNITTPISKKNITTLVCAQYQHISGAHRLQKIPSTFAY